MRSVAAVAMLVVTLVIGGCTRDEGRTTVAGGEDHPKLPRGELPSRTETASASVGATIGSDGEVASPSRPPEAQPVEYRLAAGAGKDAPKQARAYRMAPEKVDRDRVREIGKAFGVKGTVEGTEGRDFLLSDGKAAVQVAWGGLVSWSYTRTDAQGRSGSVTSSGSASCTADGRCTSTIETVPPSTVPGLPSAAEAEAKARKVLGDAGIDVTDTEAKVGGDDTESRFVNFAPQVDGVPTFGLMTLVVFGEHGRIEFAGGPLSKAQSLGNYDLADPETVLARDRPTTNGTGAPEMVELTEVAPVLLLVTAGGPRDPAYLAPAFVFGGPDRRGLGPTVAVADHELSPREQRPVP